MLHMYGPIDVLIHRLATSTCMEKPCETIIPLEFSGTGLWVLASAVTVTSEAGADLS